MSNFYFLCITQPTNLGDLIINKMLVDELCRYGKVYVDAYNTPFEFKNVLVSNPGAIDLYEEKKISAKRLNLVRLYRLAKKEGIKYYFSSPGPIEGGSRIYAIILRLIKLTFKLAGANAYCVGGCASSMISSEKPFRRSDVEHYYMRSMASVDYINRYIPNKASYIPDLAFLLALYQPMDENIQHQCSRKALVNFREDKKNPVAFLDWCKSVVHQFVDGGYEVVLYYQVQGDRDFIFKLYEATKCNGVSLIEDIVWFDNLQIYKRKDYVVSNRLHSLLIGAVYGAVPIACVSESKLISKIQDVFSTSFRELKEDIVYHYYSDVRGMFEAIQNIRKDDIHEKVLESATECRRVICDLVDVNER